MQYASAAPGQPGRRRPVRRTTLAALLARRTPPRQLVLDFHRDTLTPEESARLRRLLEEEEQWDIFHAAMPQDFEGVSLREAAKLREESYAFDAARDRVEAIEREEAAMIARLDREAAAARPQHRVCQYLLELREDWAEFVADVQQGAARQSAIEGGAHV